MSPSSLIAPVFVISGLVGGKAEAAPVPPPEIAEVQLRAVDHRLINSVVDANGALMDALTAEDFLLTERDGSWLDRAEFLSRMRQQAPLAGASSDDMSVRVYGRIAMVQAVFRAVLEDGQVMKLRYTDVHVWNGAAWRLVSAQNTPIKDAVEVRQVRGTAPAHTAWQGQDPSGDDLSVLRTLNENYVRAFREADVAWYDAHLAPQYSVVSGDGSFHDRAAALAAFDKPTFATYIKSFPVDRVSIRRFDDVALIHAENDYELKDGRKGVSRYTDIWHKQDDHWRCIAAHITVHKAPGN